MALTGFVTLSNTTTDAGSPIDAFLMRTLRQNGDLLDRSIAGLAQSLWLRNDGSDGVMTSAGFNSVKIARATTFNLNNAITLTDGMPLIILATTSITIAADINARGKGSPSPALALGALPATAGAPGNLGGGGGKGANSPGGSALLPFSNAVLALGGHAAGAANGAAAGNNDPILRMLGLVCSLAGGGGGGNGPAVPADRGGQGGGVVVLCAPQIIYTSGTIDARGEDGTGTNAGGGGGGCIICISKNPDPTITAAFANNNPHANFKIEGGVKTGTGGDGGTGRRVLLTMP